MAVKVYILLDVAQGKSEELAWSVRDKPGVMMADALEGPPDVVMVLESSERIGVAGLMMRAFEPVQNLIEGVYLLPVREDFETQRLSSTFGCCTR